MPAPHRLHEPSEGEIRWFGVVLLAVFGVLGAVVGLLTLESLRAATIFWSIGAALALLHTALRPLRRPLYDTWMALVMPIGALISQAALMLLYFGVITPIACIFRVAGRDNLQRRLDRAAQSYWVDRERARDAARYFRQS